MKLSREQLLLARRLSESREALECATPEELAGYIQKNTPREGYEFVNDIPIMGGIHVKKTVIFDDGEALDIAKEVFRIVSKQK